MCGLTGSIHAYSLRDVRDMMYIGYLGMDRGSSCWLVRAFKCSTPSSPIASAHPTLGFSHTRLRGPQKATVEVIACTAIRALKKTWGRAQDGGRIAGSKRLQLGVPSHREETLSTAWVCFTELHARLLPKPTTKGAPLQGEHTRKPQERV